ncbi:MAG: hypothetical protein JKY56_01200 [Kofleriaceae bacterium]|nr:hypothetical protein [Kofleriaceae bacterium]
MSSCAQASGGGADAGGDATVADAALPDATPDATSCVPSSELCNGRDDDCDGDIDEGYSGTGEPCDSDDSDECSDDITVCSGDGQSTICMDQGPALPELCNGMDDDCSAATPDGSDEPFLGDSCDGADSDLCHEGILGCVDGAMDCSDISDSTLELCNGVDDDCDITSADGSEDILNGVACDGADSDLCEEGMTECVAGSIACSDISGDTLELCSGQDEDCDGSVDEGFARDTNPLCSSAPLLGTISGDIGPGVLMASGGQEAWYRVTITENSFTTSSYLSATIDLDSPANVDYDLFVYCESCVGGLASSSINPAGMLDRVGIRRNDGPGDEGFDILIEVRFSSASMCADWNLTVTADTAVAIETCPF